MALPGVHKVWRSLANGRVAHHWYAWRGGGAPQIGRFEGATRAEVLQKEAQSAAAAALAAAYAAAQSRTIDTSTVGGLLMAYEASDKFKRRSESTKRNERKPIHEVRESALGKLPVALLGAKRLKQKIETWRAGIAAERGPRAADIRVEVLSKALNWAIAEGLATHNPAAGIASLHFSDRSDIIWLPADIAAFEARARAARRKLLKADAPEPNTPPASVQALLLACYTGLRREDLCNLTWRDVGPNAITVRPLKSVRRRKTAGKKAPPVVVIPRTPELNAVLALLDPGEDKRGPWVLTSSYGRKWTPAGLTSTFIKVRDAAGIVHEAPGEEPTPKRFHDCRGTFVTHMRCLGFSKEEVAEMVGWSTEDVDRIARRYADAERVALAWLERLNRAQA